MLPMFQLFRISNYDTANSYSIPLSPPPYQLIRPKTITTIRYLLLGILSMLLLLAGCGPENSANSQEELATKTQQIALAYQNHHNLTQANTELAELQVANLNQWLLYATESAIVNNTDSNATNALVVLSTDLGLHSNPIATYAMQNNLVAAAVALQPEVMITVQPTPEAIAAASQADVVTVLKDSAPAGETTATNPAEASDTATMTPTISAVAAITPTLAPTAEAGPQLVASSDINVRAGPGVEYTIAGALRQSETASIVGKNATGDWWEISLADGQLGWVYGALVATAGDMNAVAVAANIPPPPPTATPAPTQPPAATVAPAATEAPVATTAPSVDPNGMPHFTLVSRRLWGKAENDGCVGKHLLRIHVLDANGVRINGVRLKGIYTGHELVTGDQGKGDGIIEFDLHGSGEGFMVTFNNDGREATSDRAEGFTTRSLDIDKPTLINAGYCTNDQDCQIFYDSWGCQGHHSWEAIFQRNY